MLQIDQAAKRARQQQQPKPQPPRRPSSGRQSRRDAHRARSNDPDSIRSPSLSEQMRQDRSHLGGGGGGGGRKSSKLSPNENKLDPSERFRWRRRPPAGSHGDSHDGRHDGKTVASGPGGDAFLIPLTGATQTFPPHTQPTTTDRPASSGAWARRLDTSAGPSPVEPIKREAKACAASQPERCPLASCRLVTYRVESMDSPFWPASSSSSPPLPAAFAPQRRLAPFEARPLLTDPASEKFAPASYFAPLA